MHAFLFFAPEPSRRSKNQGKEQGGRHSNMTGSAELQRKSRKGGF